MHTTKEEAMSAIEKLPDTVDIDEIIKELEGLKATQEDTDIPENQPISCLDIAKKYIGCVEGPADLSTNKKYFEGFGQ
jgi:hypothetical protein